MQLAADPILIEIAGEDYELRPTLRAATRLARRYGDFATLYKHILSDHVTASGDVLREGSGVRAAAADFLTGIEIEGVRKIVTPLKLPMLRFVALLAGADEQPSSPSASTGRSLSLAAYHAELFRIGTGWLGWTPDQTWNATPAEIIAAQRGRTDLIADMLKAIFGSDDEQPQLPVPLTLNPDGTDSTFDRAALAKLKAKLGAIA